MNYAETQRDKLQLLLGILTSEGWSDIRFRDTILHLIKNNPYPTWKISDFTSVQFQKLHWYSEYLGKLSEKGSGFNSEIMWYDLSGERLWAFKNDGILPFPLWKSKEVAVAVAPVPETSDEPFDFHAFAESFRSQQIRDNKPKSVAKNLEDMDFMKGN